MDLSAGLGLAAVVLLVLANGFFVATEFAIVAVRRSRLEQLAREGSLRAKRAQEIVGRLDAYIAACQLGITMASLALGWLGEPALAALLEAPLERLVGRFAPAASHAVSITVAFALITALHILIGELAPKGLALQHPERTALWAARPLQLFYLVFRYPITALNSVGNGVLRLFGLHPSTGHEMVHSAEELELLVSASQRAGMVEESEARIASRAFQFADLTAGELMTPRTQLEAVPTSIGLDELLGRVASGAHTRLLVYQGFLDDIRGVIQVRDLLGPARRPGQPFDVRALLRPVLTVPESRRADDLLQDMRTSGRHLAVVVDEHGGTAGIVTLDDLMRALVGPIKEEPAGGPEGPDAVLPKAEPDGSMLLDGRMRLHELEELLGGDIEGEEQVEAATVGGLVMERLGRIPQVADEVAVAAKRLRVERLDGRRVAIVRLLPGAQSQSGSVTKG